jgi:DNA modification methylase
VLDPFIGSGTTAVVARRLNRNYIGFELNPKYIKISNRKIYNETGMFK